MKKEQRCLGMKVLTKGKSLLYYIKIISIFVVAGSPSIGVIAFGAAQAPTITLFPTTVVENIKETANIATQMEKDLHGTVNDLEQQMVLYQESKCAGAESDEGCGEIEKQMGQKYQEMLTQMENRLPDMERSVRATNESLEKRLRQELGLKTTPRELQKSISGMDKPLYGSGRRPSSGKLSEKFRKYYELVTLGSSKTGEGSLAVVASEIFIDTRGVADLIALTRDEISRAKLMIQLNQSYGALTPKMLQMVAGIKSIIFGEQVDIAGVPGPPSGSEKEAYVSPLEL